MYEHLDRLTENSARLLADLTPLDEEGLDAVRRRFPQCPEEYLLFMAERGAGELEDGLMFYFRDILADASVEVFGDDEVYKLGAIGSIKVFGDDGGETSYGFDTGADWRLVSVDSFRIVTHLSLSFKEFVEGLLVCYPNYPIGYDGGWWKTATGEEYSV